MKYVIYYCNNCGGLTISRRYTIKYSYEVKGVTTQSFTEARDKDLPWCRKKADISYSNIPDAQLISKSAFSCNPSIFINIYRKCKSTRLSEIYITRSLYDTLTKHVVPAQKWKRSRLMGIAFSTLDPDVEEILKNTYTFLRYCIYKDYIKAESLPLVTSILLKGVSYENS